MKISAAADIAYNIFSSFSSIKWKFFAFSCAGEHTGNDEETLRRNWRSFTETFGA